MSCFFYSGKSLSGCPLPAQMPHFATYQRFALLAQRCKTFRGRQAGFRDCWAQTTSGMSRLVSLSPGGTHGRHVERRAPDAAVMTLPECMLSITCGLWERPGSMCSKNKQWCIVQQRRSSVRSGCCTRDSAAGRAGFLSDHISVGSADQRTLKQLCSTIALSCNLYKPMQHSGAQSCSCSHESRAFNCKATSMPSKTPEP